MNAEETLIFLLRAEMQERIPENAQANIPSGEILDEVYKLATKHDLAHIAAEALSHMGALDEGDVSQQFRQASMQAVRRYLKMNREYIRICQVFEEKQIPFIPLKGSVIRDYYAEPWMRTSSDIDILVREESLPTAVKELVEKLGYSNKGRSSHDISLISQNRVHLELHFDTIEEGAATEECRSVLSEVWDDAKPKDVNSCQRRMSDEMFYFYHVAHMAKHFLSGGCGIRPFMDLAILNHKVAYDRNKREKLLAKGGLLTFARAVEDLSEVWFSEKPLSKQTERMADFILGHDISKNNAIIQQMRTGNKLKYLLSKRVFRPYVFMKARYPILKKHKWLLPFYQIVRWIEMLGKGGLKRTLIELKANAEVSPEDNGSTAEMLTQLGL